MKYNWLNPPGGSVLVFRLFIAALVTLGLVLILLFLSADEENISQLILSAVTFIWAYFGSRFSSIKYNSEDIVIQNVYGRFQFSIDDLVEIRPLRSYLSFYVIVFKDDKIYLFGGASSKFFLNDFAKEDARYLENKLRSAFQKKENT